MTAGMDSGGDQSSGMTTSIQSDDAGDKNGYYNPFSWRRNAFEGHDQPTSGVLEVETCQ